MSLRVRLTLLYVTLLLLALSASGVAGYLIVSRRIYDSVDESLKIRAQAVSEALEPLAGSLTASTVEEKGPELQDQSSADLLFQVRGADGTILYSSLEAVGSTLPQPDPSVLSQSTYSTEDVRGQDLRLLYQPILQDGTLVGTVEVAQSLKGTYSALDQVRNVLIVTGMVAAMLTSISAYTLAGRALRPVREVSQVARDIECTANFNRRLPVPGTRGEVAELITTFNAMIARVEQALIAHKAFLADSSHELRRPLTVLRTNIDVLSNPNLPEEDRRQCVAEMLAEAEVMSRLLSDLLVLAREESQVIERLPVDYSRLCTDAVERLRASDGRHELSQRIQAGVRVLGDKERLQQMVLNLLENAVQYTPEKGGIELRLDRDGESARLEVRDTGQGIESDDLPHIFDRFYRGQRARAVRPDGTGLGLSIVKYLAEAHGGSVQVKSEAGQGAEFVVELPALNGSHRP